MMTHTVFFLGREQDTHTYYTGLHILVAKPYIVILVAKRIDVRQRHSRHRNENNDTAVTDA
jgi:hypothetical protein